MNVNDLISCPDRDPWKNGLRPGLKRCIVLWSVKLVHIHGACPLVERPYDQSQIK